MDGFYLPPYSAPSSSMMIPPTRTPPPPSNAPLNPSTAIFNAVLQNNVELVKSILNETQFDPNNFRNKDGKTPLMVASFKNCPDVVKYLVGLSNVNIDLQDNDGESALYQAASIGNNEVVAILINAIANVECYNNEKITPLIVAAYHGHANVCRTLIDHGYANVNFQDNSQKTALSLACFEGHIEVVRVLLVRGANVNNIDQYGWTPLMFAAFNGQVEICQLLLSYNADSSIKAGNGKTAAVLAYEAKHTDVSNLIEDYENSKNDYYNNNDNDSYNHINNNDDNSFNEISNNNGNSNGSNYDINNNNDNISFIDINNNVNNNNYNYNDNNIVKNNDNNNNHFSVNNYYNKSPPLPPTSTSSPLQGTPQMIPKSAPTIHFQYPTLTRQPAEFYPEVPYHNTRGYLLPTSNNFNPRISRLSRATFASKSSLRTAPYLKNDMAPREQRTPWVIFSLVITSCFCNPCLFMLSNMRDPEVRQAWREKVSLVIIILSMSIFMGFLLFGLASVTCGVQKEHYYKDSVYKTFGPDQPFQKMHIVYGKIYNTGEYLMFGSHRPLTPPITDQMLNPIIYKTFGTDISDYFPIKNADIGCPVSPKNGGQLCDQSITDKNPLLHCHTSLNSINTLNRFDINQPVFYSLENVTQVNTTLFIYGTSVYDLGKYLDPSNHDKWLGADNDVEWLSSILGKDATRDIAHKGNYFKKCLPNFKVGELEGTSIGCLIDGIVLSTLTVVFTGITLIKFFSAIAFDWILSRRLGKISKNHIPDDKTSYIFLLVTCYSEGETSMRTTLDSLACTNYSDKHKLLFVIADGNVTGSENDRSTPQICKDLIEPFDLSGFDSPVPKSYLAIGDGDKQHNMAEVIIGYYNCKGHRVPICLVNKIGTPEERKGSKAGNRGKRDSQLILMKWVSNIFFDDYMTPLEFELFEKIRTLTGVTPDKYEMVLMVDADTVVMKDSVSTMVSAMESDPKVMGLCGETRIVNKTTNWVTMIQVFEYFISHHLGKSFESIFGGVTCLPGCFCMYRIRAPKYGGYWVPILANPDIVEVYSCSTAETLHQKNLLLLGEDRYLTTLMLRTFPRRKMIYVPKAVCKTVVPDEFKVLLSQRRRWINSTIHNLMELILVRQLCGIFCCSMQFVIFLELVGTVILPSSIIFLGYIIIAGAMGVNVTLPLIFIISTIFLQAFLVVFTAQKPSYIMWLLVYLLATPIWNFILPIYAFWHFDDFSWGATRKIAGEDKGHGEKYTDDFERNQIPRKRWIEWKTEEIINRNNLRVKQTNHNNSDLPPPQITNSHRSLPPPQIHTHQSLRLPDVGHQSLNVNLRNLSPSQQNLPDKFYENLPNNSSNHNVNTKVDNDINDDNNNNNNNNGSTRPMGPRSPGPRKFDVIRY